MKSEFTAFYDDRYSKGYMSDWPLEKRQRVYEIIKGLNLPDSGDALDFGCGNGIFTDVIKQALPKWNVYGTDISSVAVENARLIFPECKFFISHDKDFINKKFDFLFSHHVLEHVSDITEALDEIVSFVKDDSSMLHILPCSNEGSFEHNLCLLRKDGINKNNKYFFEDEGHVRRLNSEQVNLMLAKYGFRLTVDYYSNQYYGAIDWITINTPNFILNLTAYSNAKDSISANKLKKIRINLLTLNLLRLPSVVFNKKTLNKYFPYFLIALILYPFSQPINSHLKKNAKIEWEKRKHDKNGSEMYLYYTRIG